LLSRGIHTELRLQDSRMRQKRHFTPFGRALDRLT